MASNAVYSSDSDEQLPAFKKRLMDLSEKDMPNAKYQKLFREFQANFGRETLAQYMQPSTDEDSLWSNKETVFDNADYKHCSPTGEEPPFKPMKLGEMEQELSKPRTKMQDYTGALFVLIHSVLCFQIMARMHIYILDCGGFYFFIPLAICMVFIGVPMVFLEMALGQFSSHLSVTIFHRLIPLLKGIGYLMVLMRSLMVLSLKSEHRFATILWEVLGRKLFGIRQLSCEDPSSLLCLFDHSCPPDEIFYRGDCYNLEKLTLNDSITYETQVKLTKARILHSLELDKTFSNHLVPRADRVLGTSSVHAHFESSIFIMFFLYVVLSNRGLGNLVKMSRTVLFLYPVVGAIMISMMVYQQYPYREQFSNLPLVVESDFMMLFHYNTWFKAVFMSIMCLSIGDGTLHALGSMNNYSNNLLRDVLILVSTVFVSMVIGTFMFGAISISGIQYANKVYTMRDMTADQIRKELRRFSNVDSYVNNFYYFTMSGPWSNVIGIIIAIFALLSQLGAHALIAENLISTTLQMWPAFRKANERVVRLCVIELHFIVIGITYYLITKFIPHIDSVYNLSHITILITVFWECLAIRVYTVERLRLNVYSMFNAQFHSSPSLFTIVHKTTWFMIKSWKILTPITCLAMFLAGMVVALHQTDVNIPILFISYFSIIPILMATRQVMCVFAIGETLVPDLLRPSSKWGPYSVQDKIEAGEHERGARYS